MENISLLILNTKFSTIKREITEILPELIDKGIIEERIQKLIIALNNFPSILTLASCEGHINYLNATNDDEYVEPLKFSYVLVGAQYLDFEEDKIIKFLNLIEAEEEVKDEDLELYSFYIITQKLYNEIHEYLLKTNPLLIWIRPQLNLKLAAISMDYAEWKFSFYTDDEAKSLVFWLICEIRKHGWQLKDFTKRFVIENLPEIYSRLNDLEQEWKKKINDLLTLLYSYR